MIERRRHRHFTVAILTLLLALQIAWPTRAHATTDEQPGLDIVLLIDNSRSMRLRHDKLRLRTDAARMFLDYLNLVGPSTPATRVGVVSFGEANDGGVRVPLLDAQNENVRAAIRTDDLIYTDFEFALTTARGYFQQGQSEAAGRTQVIVLLTDGRPCTSQMDAELPGEADFGCPSREVTDAEIAAYFESTIRNALAGYQGALYVLGLGDDVEGDAERWSALAAASGGKYQKVETAGQLLAAYTDVLHALLQGYTRLTTQTLDASATNYPLPVNVAFPQTLTFTFVQRDLTQTPSADRILTLQGPDGSVRDLVSTKQKGNLTNGRYEIFALPDAPGGVYTATLSGKPTAALPVEVWIDAIEPVLRVAELPERLYRGQQVEIRAWLERNGAPVVTDDLQLKLIMSSAAGDDKPLDLTDPNGDGFYTLPLTQYAGAGVYTLRIDALQNNRGIYTVTVPAPVTIVAPPTVDTLRMTPPRPVAGDPVRVTLVAHDLDQAVNPVAIFVLRRAGVLIATHAGTRTAQGFDADFNELTAGEYELSARLTADGLPPEVQPPPLQRTLHVDAPSEPERRLHLQIGPLSIVAPHDLHERNPIIVTHPITASSPITATTTISYTTKLLLRDDRTGELKPLPRLSHQKNSTKAELETCPKGKCGAQTLVLVVDGRAADDTTFHIEVEFPISVNRDKTHGVLDWSKWILLVPLLALLLFVARFWLLVLSIAVLKALHLAEKGRLSRWLVLQNNRRQAFGLVQTLHDLFKDDGAKRQQLARTLHETAPRDDDNLIRKTAEKLGPLLTKTEDPGSRELAIMTLIFLADNGSGAGELVARQALDHAEQHSISTTSFHQLLNDLSRRPLNRERLMKIVQGEKSEQNVTK